MSFDVDEFLEGLEARTAEARVLQPNRALRARHAELEAELRQAIADDAALNREPVAPDLADQLLALESEIEQAEVKVFTFAGLGTRGWLDLMAKHPPTKAQRTENPHLDNNPETFPAAAIAASSHDPKLSLTQAKTLEDKLDMAEWNKIWAAVLDANLGGDGRPKSVLAGMIRRQSEPSEVTAASEESPEVSSSGE